MSDNASQDDQPTTSTVPSAIAATPVGSESPWWSESRKVIVGWTIAIILTPVSVWVSSWLTDVYKSPYPKIQYIKPTFWHLVNGPDKNFAAQINEDTLLGPGIRQDITAKSIALNRADTCGLWLDGGDWEPDCLDIYRGILTSTDGQLQRSIFEIKHGIDVSKDQKPGPLKDIGQIASRPDQLLQWMQTLRLVRSFQGELTRVEQMPNIPSGDVDFKVGILNAGDLDGVVYSRCELTFGGQDMKIYADDYKPIKAHSFEEIVFSSLNFEDSQNKQHDAFLSLVKGRAAVPLKLRVTLSDKTQTGDYTLPVAP